MPETENTVTLKGAMGQSVRNVHQFVAGPAGSEVAAVLVVMMLVALVTAPLALFADGKVSANGPAPVNPCKAQIMANSNTRLTKCK